MTMGQFDDTYRKEVNSVAPYIQGETEDEVRRKFHLDKVVKLGSNENPYGPYYHARKAIIRSVEGINRYPEDDFINTKRVIANQFGLKADNVGLGSGAGNIIETISKMFLNAGDEVLIAKQSYRLYREVSKLMGAKVIEIPLTKDYQFDLQTFNEKINDKTKLIWICNPNNPTSAVTDPQALERFIADLPDHVWVVVDEAYADFAKPEHLPNLLQFIGHKRVLILRTMSKAYGLAGARLGFLLGEPTAIAAYDTVTEPFNSNRSVLAATIASFKYDQPQFKRALKRIWGDKVGLTESLEILDCEVARSDANFVFVKLPDGAPSATEVTNQLMAQGVIVRDGTPWGYPDHIRVTIGKHDELEFFLEKFQAILNQ